MERQKKIKGGFRGFNQNTFNRNNVNARAALLSGSPGIGKTTTARLVAEKLGYDIVEWNASTLRNKKGVVSQLGVLHDNLTCDFGGNLRKTLILMDEVDGMSSDRGGTAALVSQIKKTKVPILCICNNRGHPKMRSLANHCYDLHFNKPRSFTLAKRLTEICTVEGLKVDQNSLTSLVDQMRGDVRQILNFLQMWHRRSDTFIYRSFMENKNKFSKDDKVTISNFDAAKIILNSGSRSQNNYSYRELMNMFFIDHQIIPLFVQENYLKSMTYQKDFSSLQQMAKAADSVARGDIVNTSIRTNMNWSLLPTFGFNSSLYPTHLAKGFIGHVQFPRWFGSNSTTNKMKRLVTELKSAIMHKTTGTNESVKNDYAPMLLKLLKARMKEEDYEGAVDIFETYDLTPVLVKEHLQDIIYNPSKRNLLDGIVSKNKAAVTRMYNKAHKDSFKPSKKTKKTKVKEQDFIEELSEETEEEEEDEIIEMPKKSKKTKKK